jgi:ribosomal protein L37AE/L43A
MSQIMEQVMHQDLSERIRKRAYEMWIASGYRDGEADQHWLAAEQEILSSRRSAAVTKAPAKQIRGRATVKTGAAGLSSGPSYQLWRPMVQIVDGEAPAACPACGRQMRHIADFEIYECRECRLFVNEKVKDSDVNNVNTSSMEHSSHVDYAA